LKRLASPWKEGRNLFRQCVGKLFYQLRVDKKGNPTSLRPFFGKLNQRLMEKGYATPWILTRNECWELHTVAPYANDIAFQLIQKPQGIVQFLHEFWSPQVEPADSVLELGSGPGANLNYLYKLGYKNLKGIEIKQETVDKMNETFPELMTRCEVTVGSLEDVLPEFGTDSVDVIFTMAVAEEIHPTSNFLFKEMVRMARKYICTIEMEVGNCGYIFSRNYRRVFQSLGCSQIKSTLITKGAFPNVNRGYDGYIARLFCKQR
jgi:SAM-dependent methyltransferase